MQDRDPVELLADEILKRYRQGERPDAGEFVEAYPELAEDLPAILQTLVELEQCFPRADSPDRPDDLAGPMTVQEPRFWQLGDYHLLREVGRGGMGVVYEAEQLSLGRRVALKILPSHIVFDRAVLERFRREARAAARLHHSNIVPVFEVGREGEIAYYAMQFIQGRGLDRVIEELIALREQEGSTPVVSLDGKTVAVREGGSSQGDCLSHAARSLWTGHFAEDGFDPGASMVAIPSTDATLFEPDDGPQSVSFDDRPDSSPPPTESEEEISWSGRRSGGRKPFFRSAARLGRQVAQALAYAHGRGIVHRDIKPSNLLLDGDGVVWVTDFGLAQVEQDRPLTRTGDLLGTLRYMAPECFGNRADARADLYALGLTLYELITLRPAFQARDRLQLVEQIRTQEPTAPRAIDPSIPRDLETIILKAIDKNPETRYQNALAMAEDLGRFLDDQPIAARPIGPVERLFRWGRRKPDQAVLTGVVFGLLMAIAAVSSMLALRLDQNAREARASALAAKEEAAKALQARQEADAANLALSTAQEDLRRNLYAANVNAALSAWEANDMGRFRILLERASAEENRDLFGWEWNYLRLLAGPEQRTFAEHSREVNQVAFSPDGQTIASIQWGGLVRLWDPSTGIIRRTLAGSDNLGIVGPLSIGVYGVAFSPDGRIVAAQGPENLLPACYEVATGRLISSCRGPDGAVLSLAISPDGQRLAGVTAKHALFVWEVKTGRLLNEVHEAHRGPGGDLAFCPDGKTLVTVGFGGEVRLWDVEPLRLRATLVGHAGPVRGVAISPDGLTAASVGQDGTIRLWDIPGEQESRILQESGPILAAVAFSPDGRRLASAGIDKKVTVWDLESAQPIQIFQGHTDGISSVSFSPDGRQLASASFDQTVRIWDLNETSQPQTLPKPLDLRIEPFGLLDRPFDLAYSPDGSRIAASYTSGYLREWTASQRELVRLVTLLDDLNWSTERNVNALTYSPDGRTIVISRPDYAIVFTDAETGEEQMTIPAAHQLMIKDLVYHPDGQQLVSVSNDGRLRLWDLETRKALFTYEGQPEGIHEVAFSSDGRLLASSGVNGTVKLIDATNGVELRSLEGHTGAVYSVVIHPDGKVVASSGADATIRLWDLESGRLLRILNGHLGSVNHLRFSPDGRRLASAGSDRTVRLWDPSSGLELLTMKDHDGWVRRVAFSPDGRQLASASDDTTVKVRDTLTGRP